MLSDGILTSDSPALQLPRHRRSLDTDLGRFAGESIPCISTVLRAVVHSAVVARRALVGSVIRSGADIVGFQDATAKQARDIQAGLRSKYGCRRTETGTKAEVRHSCLACIVCNTDKFESLDAFRI